MSNPDENKTIIMKEKKKMYNNKYYNAKKTKIQNEKVENEKKGVLIEDTTKQIQELREQFTKQFADIQNTLTRLLADKIINDTQDDYQPVVKEPINRYIKSLQVPSSSYTSNQSQSEESESEIEIDADGNII